MRFGWLICFILITFTTMVGAQEDQRATEIIEQRIEFLSQDLESENIDFTALFDDLLYYHENPLNINAATREDLERLSLLNTSQIMALLYERDKRKGFKTIYELKDVKGFNVQVIDLILPFVTLAEVEKKNAIRLKNVVKYSRHELILREQRRWPDAEGFAIPDSLQDTLTNNHYAGSPDRVYARYRMRYRRNLSLGFTVEKDPGEEIFGQTQPKGFDFYSAHVYVEDIGIIKQAIIGDYNLQFGQGLTMWSGFGMRKSSLNPTQVERYGRGIRAYTSSEENLFLRGAAAGLSLTDNITLHVFYSQRQVDANLDTALADADELFEGASFSSLQQTGLHRTPSELLDKDAIQMRTYGARLSGRIKRLELGATIVRDELEGQFNRSKRFYQVYEFSGSQSLSMGFDYRWNLNEAYVFGEVSRGNLGNIAQLHGIGLPLDQRLHTTLYYRNFPANFQSLHANAFGEKSGSNNEEGLYIGMEALPIQRVSLNGYFDLFRFPWLTSTTNRPSSGSEYAAQLTYTPRRGTEWLLLWREEVKGINSDEVRPITTITDRKLQQARVQFTFSLNEQWKVRTRAEYRKYTEDDILSDGFLLYQDINFDSKNGKWGARFRYAIYETDDYNSRIYAYENDIRFAFSVPAYYNRGARTYIVATYKPAKWVQLQLKLAQSYQEDEDSFGSGKDEIISPVRNEVRAQAIFKF